MGAPHVSLHITQGLLRTTFYSPLIHLIGGGRRHHGPRSPMTNLG